MAVEVYYALRAFALPMSFESTDMSTLKKVCQRAPEGVGYSGL